MIRRAKDMLIESKKMFDGAGEAEMHRILQTPEEMYNKGRVFSHMVLHPGTEVGYHVHHGDGETYYILKGKAEYNDNGHVITLEPGDVSFTDDGEGHGIKAVGDEDLEFIALILYK